MKKNILAAIALIFLSSAQLQAIDDEGNSESLYEAAWRGDVAYFAAFLAEKPTTESVTAYDNAGFSALYWAIKGKHLKIVELLKPYFGNQTVRAAQRAHLPEPGPILKTVGRKRGRVHEEEAAPIEYADSFAEVDHP
jgi:hypothetical protein